MAAFKLPKKFLYLLSLTSDYWIDVYGSYFNTTSYLWMKKYNFIVLAGMMLNIYWMVKKFFFDFDIFCYYPVFESKIFKWPTWIKYFTQSGLLLWAYDWAISFSWWGKIKSIPPEWISMFCPRTESAIAEHSICQPGLPYPQGESHFGSPGFAAFQRAKSSLCFFPNWSTSGA